MRVVWSACASVNRAGAAGGPRVPATSYDMESPASNANQTPAFAFDANRYVISSARSARIAYLGESADRQIWRSQMDT
jgi:hypothetical protein